MKEGGGREGRWTKGWGKRERRRRRAFSRASGLGAGIVGAKEEARTCLLPQGFFFCFIWAEVFFFFLVMISWLGLHVENGKVCSGNEWIDVCVLPSYWWDCVLFSNGVLNLILGTSPFVRSWYTVCRAEIALSTLEILHAPSLTYLRSPLPLSILRRVSFLLASPLTALAPL